MLIEEKKIFELLLILLALFLSKIWVVTLSQNGKLSKRFTENTEI